MARSPRFGSVNSSEEKIRLDKWLWAARFFKTRSLATDAISGGHVHVNGVRGKPSRPVLIGDELRIRKGPQALTVVVKMLSANRGPAAVARELYEETEASQRARAQNAEQRRLAAMSTPRPDHRPNKRERRRIIRFTRGED